MNYDKILVTGAAGFIGFHLCRFLLNKGYNVMALDNINDYYDVNLKLARLRELGINKDEAEEFNKLNFSNIYLKFAFVRMDIRDLDKLKNLFEEESFDAVINLAAQVGVRYSLENPQAYIDSNIVGYFNVLECCRQRKIKHLVYASSSSVYGENDKVPFSENDFVDGPVSLYAATKKSNELMAYTYSHLYQIPTSGLRFFTVYGPWGRPDMAPMLFASAITEDRPIKVFNEGNMSRDFTFVDDIVQGIFITLNNPPSRNSEKPYYQLFNIGNGNSVPLSEFIETLESELGKVAIKKMLSMQPGDVLRTWSDTSSLQSKGYESITSIKEGVKKFIAWFQDYYERSISY